MATPMRLAVERRSARPRQEPLARRILTDPPQKELVPRARTARLSRVPVPHLKAIRAVRYRDEFPQVLSNQAPDLQEAFERAKPAGTSYLILDGTIISRDRLGDVKISKKDKEIDAWYSGNVRAFGGNLQALMDPDGIPLWISDVLPGSVHDLSAAREPVLAILWLYSKGMPTPADRGFPGTGCGVLTPVPRCPGAKPASRCTRAPVLTTRC